MSGEFLNIILQEIISYTKQNGFKEIHFKCHGDCLHNTTTFQSDFMKKDYFCKAFKLIFDNIRNVLRPYNNANVIQNAQ
jgi:sulfatase maturation enzyme AslB (radical SAM superfamily)